MFVLRASELGRGRERESKQVLRAVGAERDVGLDLTVGEITT